MSGDAGRKVDGSSMAKYVFVTGGVVSALGKGIASASLGNLLRARGLKVVLQKFDPYLNVDPGTMSPFQHGEVFVLDDGAECDLDLGHYERFTSGVLSRMNNLTSGQVFDSVIKKERRGEYLGKTVQVDFKLTNVGDQPLTFTEAPYVEVVEGCCPPTPTIGSMSLKPGESTTLSVSFMMHGDMGGKHNFRVHVSNNDTAGSTQSATILSNWLP